MIINKFSINMGNMGCVYDEFFPQAESDLVVSRASTVLYSWGGVMFRRMMGTSENNLERSIRNQAILSSGENSTDVLTP